MHTPLTGLYTALITPFYPDGSLNEEGLKNNIRFQLTAPVDGIVILGTTGEAPTLLMQEKEHIIKIAREETIGRCHLMVGTGCNSTQQTIENTRMAKDMGADSVLVVTPYYNKPTQEGLYQHYTTLAHPVEIPILVYNVQGRTGVNLQTETLKRLSMIEQIIGVKEASGNMIQMMEVIENILSQRPNFSILSGDDALAYPLITLGGHGVISVLSNLLPAEMKELCNLTLNHQYTEARSLHFKLLPLMRNLFIETNPIPIKAAMNLCGYAAGPCRLPLSMINKDHLLILKKTLKEHFLSNSDLNLIFD